MADEKKPKKSEKKSEKSSAPLAGEAITKLGQQVPDEQGAKENITEEQAAAAADALEPVVEEGSYDRLQDHANFEVSRAEEAVGQGVTVPEQTVQKSQFDTARQEEAQAQGVPSIEHTTQKTMFDLSRREEIQSEYREQAAHGPVEPVTIGPGGRDDLAEQENQKLTVEQQEQNQRQAVAEADSKQKQTAKK